MGFFNLSFIVAVSWKRDTPMAVQVSLSELGVRSYRKRSVPVQMPFKRNKKSRPDEPSGFHRWDSDFCSQPFHSSALSLTCMPTFEARQWRLVWDAMWHSEETGHSCSENWAKTVWMLLCVCSSGLTLHLRNDGVSQTLVTIVLLKENTAWWWLWQTRGIFCSFFSTKSLVRI